MADSDIAGIDLGTTNSLIGMVDSGFPILLADAEGQRLTPSVVHFPECGEPLIGRTAMRMRSVAPERTISSVKRLMGRRGGEVDGSELEYGLAGVAGKPERVVLPDGSQHSPEQVSALILQHLKALGEAASETSLDRAVITVPAYFNDGQRTATKRAGETAGFQVERILNEPTAAALAYGMDRLSDQSRVAVFDFGGGTFDISVLELNEGVFQVQATHGDTRLGGDDIDWALAVYLWECFCGDSLENAGPEERAKILGAAEHAKRALSVADVTEISIPFLSEMESFSHTLSRSVFEELVRPVINKTRAHCLQAIHDASVSMEAIDEVVLVGGSTRIPLVQSLVGEIFGKDPNMSQHPDEAIALGATIQGGILSGQLKKMVLLDVTPLSLGIETFGGLMNVILPRNTTIPAKAGEMFTNAVANQVSMQIRVLQGEREMARDNWELGEMEIPFEKGAKGSARVGVQFAIDENGILEILVRDTRTGEDRVLEIKSAVVDVEDEEVEKMISESVDFAFEDMSERVWTEARLKSEELLPAVDLGVSKVGGKLSPADREAIDQAVLKVKEALAGDDAQKLKAANAELDDATETMAALLVEQAMDEALTRRGVTDSS